MEADQNNKENVIRPPGSMTVFSSFSDGKKVRVDESGGKKKQKPKPQHLQKILVLSHGGCIINQAKIKERLYTNVPPLLTQDLGSLSLLEKNHKPSSLQTAGLPFLDFSSTPT